PHLDGRSFEDNGGNFCSGTDNKENVEDYDAATLPPLSIDNEEDEVVNKYLEEINQLPLKHIAMDLFYRFSNTKIRYECALTGALFVVLEKTHDHGE
ncbi:542_t:CDS:2, partial [Diversispora eburnea]